MENDHIRNLRRYNVLGSSDLDEQSSLKRLLDNPELYYPATNEIISWTKATLNAKGFCI